MRPEPSPSQLAGVGLSLAAAFLLPFFLGVGVDNLAHTGPVFLLLGLGVGILLTVVVAFVRFKQFL